MKCTFMTCDEYYIIAQVDYVLQNISIMAQGGYAKTYLFLKISGLISFSSLYNNYSNDFCYFCMTITNIYYSQFRDYGHDALVHY